jgi:hypothetical protein
MLLLSSSAMAAEQGLTTFNVPGARNTFPFDINAKGDVVGVFEVIEDGIPHLHGFVRMSNGNLTMLGALVTPVGITTRGWVAGSRDSSSTTPAAREAPGSVLAGSCVRRTER